MKANQIIAIACAEVDWEFECLKSWADLIGTDEKDVRYCESCQRKVYLCADVEQVNRRARLAQCVAWCNQVEPHESENEEVVTIIGLPVVPFDLDGSGS